MSDKEAVAIVFPLTETNVVAIPSNVTEPEQTAEPLITPHAFSNEPDVPAPAAINSFALNIL